VAAKHGITGYDAQYVALTQAVPKVGVSMQEFIEL
jgi:hypothetical protein